MKKHEIIFSVLRVPLDYIIMYVCFFLAKNIRLTTDGIPGVILPIQTLENTYLHTYALVGAALYVGLFATHRLYSLSISGSKIGEILDIIRYGVYWFLFFSVGVYLGNGFLYSGEEIPRLIILFTMMLSVIGSIMLRFVINIIQSRLLQKGHISKRNLLLISNIAYKKLIPILEDIGNSQIYNIIGYANPESIKHYNLKHITHIEKTLKNHRCDEILYIDSDFSKKELYHIWELSRIYGVRYRYITNNFDITKTNTSLSLINKTPVIEIQNTPLENWNKILKRLFDIFFSMGVIIFLSPLFIVIGILIKLEDSKGPIIYKNMRIGQNGKIFHCYKFRYIFWKYCVKESYGIENKDDPALKFENKLISKNNKRDDTLYKIKNDPRKTKIGSFLEKYSLDELPQFFNVIKGEMSVIGPRPHQPREVKKYKQYHHMLLTIKPGITGMAQVNGREENNFEKEAKLDIFYIENWSFLLDLKILFKTISLLFNRK